MKKGILKQVFALFLAVTMLVTSVPVTAYASTDVPVVETEDIVVEDDVKTEEGEAVTPVTVEDVNISKNYLKVSSSQMVDSLTVTVTTNGGTEANNVEVAFRCDSNYEVVEVPMTYVADGVYEGLLTMNPDNNLYGQYFLDVVTVDDVEADFYKNINFIFKYDNSANEEDDVVIEQPIEITDIELSKTVLTVNDAQPSDSLTVTAYVEGGTAGSQISVSFNSDASYGSFYVTLNYVEEGVYQGTVTYNMNSTYTNTGEYYFVAAYIYDNTTEPAIERFTSNYYEPLQFRLVKNLTGEVADATVENITLNSESVVLGGTATSSVLFATATVTGGNINTTIEAVYTGEETGDTFRIPMSYASAETFTGILELDENTAQRPDTYKLTKVLVNGKAKEFAFESAFTYENVGAAITDLTISTTKVVLTDEQPSVDIEMSAKLSDVVSAEDVEHICLEVICGENWREVYLLDEDDDGIYVGLQHVDYGEVGTYTLDSVRLIDSEWNGTPVYYDGTLSYEVTADFEDKTAPVVKSITMYNSADEVVESGAELPYTESLRIVMEVEDAIGVMSVDASTSSGNAEYYGLCWDINDLDGIIETTIWFENNGYAGREWNLGTIILEDKAGNITEYDASNIRFCVTDDMGNYEEAKYTFPVYFRYANGSMYSQYWGEVSTDKKEMSIAEMFPDNLPTATTFEGVTFKGWDLTSTEEIETYSVNDKINIVEAIGPYGGGNLDFVAVYDKVMVTVWLQYWSNDGLASKQVQVAAPYGTTYETFIKNFRASKYYKLSNIKHNSKITLKSWEMNGYYSPYMANQPISHNQGFSFVAKYNKIPVIVSADYCGENGYQQYKYIGEKFLAAGTTYDDYAASFNPGVTHNPNLVFEEWLPVVNSGGTAQEVKMGHLQMKADYDQTEVTLFYNYYDENDRYAYHKETITVPERSKYKDIINEHEAPDVTHTSKLGEFQGWKVYQINYANESKNNLAANGAVIVISAQYEQNGVEVTRTHINEAGVQCWDVSLQVVGEGVSYDGFFYQHKAAVLDAVEHNKGAEFVEWVYSCGSYWGIDTASEISGVSMMRIDAGYKNPDNVSYTVTFETNGGDPLTEEDSYKYVRKNTAIGTLPKATKEGYTLKGWYTAPEGGTKVATTTKVTQAMTLFAQWTPNTYSVKFNANGGTGKMANQTLTYDAASYLTSNAFTRKGYDFAGWSTTADGEVAFMNMEEVINFTAEKGKVVNLYAQWTPIEYTINYVLNDTQEDPAVFEEVNPTVYNATMAAITLENPTREHYQFAGWYSDAKFKTKVTNIKAGSTGDKTFYAKWTANKYTINFDKNDEGATGTMKAMANLAYDKEYTLTKVGFAKKGYNFLGWATEKDGEVVFENLAKVEGLVEENTGSITLYAVWEKATYNVTYNLNGGTNAEGNPASYQVDTETFTLENPTKEGYTFAGWFTDAKFKKKAVTTIKAGTTGNKTFYAKWTANKYTVKFDKNAPADLTVTGSMKNQSMTYDKQAALTANAYKLKGYKFLGWADAKSLQEEQLSDKVKYTNKEKVSNLPPEKGEVVTLYAVWEKETYTITYVLGETEESQVTNPNAEKTSYDIDLEEDIVFEAPTREGYRFVAWYADAKYKTKITKIAPGTTGNKTIYAKWVGEHDYTINFVAEGEDVTGSTKAIKGVKYGKTVTLTANGFKKRGYNFAGWATEETKDAQTIEEQVVYTNKAKVVDIADIEADSVTIYAVWELAEYTITYKDGGDNPESNRTSYTIDADEDIELAEPTKEGYTFKGWYSDAKFKKAITTLKLEGQTGNKTVYAKWAANKYTVVFDANEEESQLTQPITGTTKQMSMTYGKKTALNANGFKAKGFKVIGWATEPDGEVVYTNKQKVSNLAAENGATVTLYAVWDIETYTIKYVLNGGTNNPSNPTSYNVASPIILNKPTREGYTFAGWCTDKTLKKQLPAAFEGENAPQGYASGNIGNKTFYAKWTANKYNIVFDKNLGEGQMDVTGTMKDVKNVAYGKTVTLANNTYKRTGYKFLGWSTSADGSTGLIKNKQKVKNLSAENGATVTLYAQWDIIEYTIKYNVNGGTLSEEAKTTYTVEDAFTLEEPTMDGYEFVGWYKDAKGKTKITAIEKGDMGNLTLYALWRKAN